MKKTFAQSNVNKYIKLTQCYDQKYEELLARHDTDFAKLKDGYDDFFGFELEKMKKTE